MIRSTRAHYADLQGSGGVLVQHLGRRRNEQPPQLPETTRAIGVIGNLLLRNQQLAFERAQEFVRSGTLGYCLDTFASYDKSRLAANYRRGHQHPSVTPSSGVSPAGSPAAIEDGRQNETPYPTPYGAAPRPWDALTPLGTRNIVAASRLDNNYNQGGMGTSNKFGLAGVALDGPPTPTSLQLPSSAFDVPLPPAVAQQVTHRRFLICIPNDAENYVIGNSLRAALVDAGNMDPFAGGDNVSEVLSVPVSNALDHGMDQATFDGLHSTGGGRSPGETEQDSSIQYVAQTFFRTAKMNRRASAVFLRRKRENTVAQQDYSRSTGLLRRSSTVGDGSGTGSPAVVGKSDVIGYVIPEALDPAQLLLVETLPPLPIAVCRQLADLVNATEAKALKIFYVLASENVPDLIQNDYLDSDYDDFQMRNSSATAADGNTNRTSTMAAGGAFSFNYGGPGTTHHDIFDGATSLEHNERIVKLINYRLRVSVLTGLQAVVREWDSNRGFDHMTDLWGGESAQEGTAFSWEDDVYNTAGGASPALSAQLGAPEAGARKQGGGTRTPLDRLLAAAASTGSNDRSGSAKTTSARAVSGAGGTAIDPNLQDASSMALDVGCCGILEPGHSQANIAAEAISDCVFGRNEFYQIKTSTATATSSNVENAGARGDRSAAQVQLMEQRRLLFSVAPELREVPLRWWVIQRFQEVFFHSLPTSNLTHDLSGRLFFPYDQGYVKRAWHQALQQIWLDTERMARNQQSAPFEFGRDETYPAVLRNLPIVFGHKAILRLFDHALVPTAELAPAEGAPQDLTDFLLAEREPLLGASRDEQGVHLAGRVSKAGASASVFDLQHGRHEFLHVNPAATQGTSSRSGSKQLSTTPGQSRIAGTPGGLAAPSPAAPGMGFLKQPPSVTFGFQDSQSILPSGHEQRVVATGRTAGGRLGSTKPGAGGLSSTSNNHTRPLQDQDGRMLPLEQQHNTTTTVASVGTRHDLAESLLLPTFLDPTRGAQPQPPQDHFGRESHQRGVLAQQLQDHGSGVHPGFSSSAAGGGVKRSRPEWSADFRDPHSSPESWWNLALRQIERRIPLSHTISFCEDHSIQPKFWDRNAMYRHSAPRHDWLTGRKTDPEQRAATASVHALLEQIDRDMDALARKRAARKK
ncbi:unnamed protein product [Amoebophrya sp. A25]|nr:unnamed protein product [Amoebophrya sp. A25]|eukprot:GSA25T00000688001.1